MAAYSLKYLKEWFDSTNNCTNFRRKVGYLMKFPRSFRINIKNEKELVILWACFNISFNNIITSLASGDTKLIKDTKKMLCDKNSFAINSYFGFKTDLWNRVEDMINKLENMHKSINNKKII